MSSENRRVGRPFTSLSRKILNAKKVLSSIFDIQIQLIYTQAGWIFITSRIMGKVKYVQIKALYDKF